MYEDDAYSAATERLGNLLQAAGARHAIPEPAELTDPEMQRFANVIGPTWAALYAAGLCGELIARSFGIDPDGDRSEIPALDIEALAQGSETEIAGSAEALLGAMADLIEVVKQDISTLGSLAVSTAGEPLNR